MSNQRGVEMTPEGHSPEQAAMPHPTLSQPWGDPDYDPSCPDCREGRHGRRAAEQLTEATQEPRTDVGREYLSVYPDDGRSGQARGHRRRFLVAIESEARQALLAELREAVEGLPSGLNQFWYDTYGQVFEQPTVTVSRAAVLALLEERSAS